MSYNYLKFKVKHVGYFNTNFSELYELHELLDVKNSYNSYNSLKFVLNSLA